MPLSKKDKILQEQEEFAKRQYFDGIEQIRAHIDSKNKYKNLTRCLNTLRIEEQNDKEAKYANEPVLVRQAEIEEEQRLARELDKVKRDEIREKKLRQHLRENSHELKELESKLRAAYITKELKAQIAEKEALKLQEKLAEKEAYKILESAWLDDREHRHQQMQNDIIKRDQYKQELQDQMIFKEKNRRFEYEEFLREKKMLDDIIQRIHDEDIRAIEERMYNMKKTQEEIQAFKAAQEEWRKKQKLELAEENRKIQEYLLSKASDARARQEEKERKEAIKEKISDNIAKQIYEVEQRKREREEIMLQLLEEEKKEEIEKRHKEEVEKQIRQRIETLTSLSRQMEDRQEQLRKQVEEDALYKEQLIAKVVEDERLEQLSNAKKRLKLVQIRKDVEQMMIQRRQQKAEEMRRQIKLLELEAREAEERRRIIQEERIRMLQEHAKNLIGYLPKAILQPDDLPYLGSDIIEKYGKNNHNKSSN